MPGDIRSFFGGGGGAPAQSSSRNKEAAEPPKKKGRPSRRVVQDSDDDEPVEKPAPKKAAAKKPQAKKPASPTGEETTSSAYFGTKKPKRSEPPKTSAAVDTPKKTPAKKNTAKDDSPKKESVSKRTTPARRKKTTSYAEPDDDEDGAFLDDEDDDDEDIFTANFKKNGRKGGDEYEESEDDEGKERILPHRSAASGKNKKSANQDDDDASDVDMKDAAPVSRKKAATTKPTKKRKSTTPEEDEDEDDFVEEDEPPKKKRGRKPQDSSNKSPPKKRVKKEKKEEVNDSAEVQAIYAAIPLVRPPTPPPPSGAPAKFNFRAAGAGYGSAPAAGTLDIPDGAPNCLAGLSFVFTGILQQLSRDEGQALVKRYGGRVVGAPSKKTSYVVLGSDAGPKKLETIRTCNIKTIDEHGLMELIKRLPANGGDSKAAAAYEDKQNAEAKKIEAAAAEMEQEERERKKKEQAAQKRKTAASGATIPPSTAGKHSSETVDNRLWTVKYAPSQLSQICGNKGQVEKLGHWLRNFPRAQKTGWKLPGQDGSGLYRAVLIHGPPGIGKTTAAHLVAKLEGYDIVESNASDTRSKKLVEEGLKGVVSTTSLFGYFAGDGQSVEASKKKLVLIMDEVDGMSAGDRGGVGAMAKVCKTSQIPMILICNDRRLPKMKPFDHVTYDLPFRRPTVENIRSRISTIAFREKLKLPPQVVSALIEGSNADIRQVVNMISTIKVDQSSMDYDGSKQMSKAWQKHIILKPWDIISKMLGGGMFAESSKTTLNEKIELYFNDHEFSYLMMQENYLGTNPIQSLPYQGKEKNLKMLELAEKAAESISDGDLVDRMIHGSQQQWSLMPTHAVFSFVKPASYQAGSMAGHKTNFTSWLGKNSSQQKLTRFIKEIQGHMRLRSSGDRHEIRQQYVPILWSKTVKRLQEDGKAAVPEIIDLMDSYFLTKEDYDAILELGVGPMDQSNVTVDTQTKSAFTRQYNAQSHPLPFMKASNVTLTKKVAKDVPDLEEAIEEEEDDDVEDAPVKAEEEEADLSKDKYIKQPKKKKAPAKASAKGKKNKAQDDEDESGDAKPKKKARAPAKGKGKK